MATVFGIAALVASFSSGWPAFPDTVLRGESVFGSFGKSTRLAVSPQGWIYVVDENENTIHVLKDRRKDFFAIGGYGWTAHSFDKPTGLATDGINVYISDYGNHRIQRFDRSLSFVSSLTTRDTTVARARFGYPVSVAISKSGDLLVVDGENLRIVRFSADSRYLQTFGSFDAGRGKLLHPGKIVISNDDRIYVAEPDRIVEFDYFGNFARIIGGGILQGVRCCEATETVVLAANKDTIFWFSKAGTLTLQTPIRSVLTSEPLEDIQDVVLVQNLMYVLDSKRVFVFSVCAN